MDGLVEAFPYIVMALAGWYAGYASKQRDSYRAMAMALMWVILIARKRGVYFSPFDNAIVERAAKELEPHASRRVG